MPNYVKVLNFVNADDISRGLSPLDYSSMNIKAGKLMLNLIKEYTSRSLSFGFETTLAGRKWLSLIDDLKKNNYAVFIYFLDLASIELSVSRVKYRVESGGHDIPEETICRRYIRSRHNFWKIYKEKADKWALFNNSGEKAELVASCDLSGIDVVDEKYYAYFFNSLMGGK